MATILDDLISAVADTFADMKTVLEDDTGIYKDITTVYMGSDIAQPADYIRIPLSKPNVVIDGTYNGIRRTYTTTVNSAANFITYGTVGADKPILHATMQHVDIVGNNYYGAMGASDSANNLNLTLTYLDVNYRGSQACYNRYGTVRFIDSILNIDNHEITECGRAELGGKVVINHTMASYSSFWMYYNVADAGGASSQYIKVLEGADVSLTSLFAAFYIQPGARLIVEDNARLIINAAGGIAYNTSAFSSVSVGEGATLDCTQTIDRYALLYVDGEMSVEQGAVVSLVKSAGTYPVIALSTASTLSVQSPDFFLLRNNVAGAVVFGGACRLSLIGGQVNFWSQAPRSDDPGGFTDLPAYSWRKTSAENQTVPETRISGSSTNTVFTTDDSDTNLEPAELVGKPLSGLLLNRAFAFSMGNLPLWVNPVADDGWPVFGTTSAGANLHVAYEIEGTEYTDSSQADSDGVFSIPTSAGNLELGFMVTVTAGLPFLLTSGVMNVVPVGDIEIVGSESQLILSYNKRVSQTPEAYGREMDNWSLTVSDSRARSTAWRLYAATEHDMQSLDEAGEIKHTLPGALVFVDESSRMMPVGQTPVLILNGESNGGNLDSTTTVSWSSDKGILLARSTEPIWAKERYSADIAWQIETED